MRSRRGGASESWGWLGNRHRTHAGGLLPHPPDRGEPGGFLVLVPPHASVTLGACGRTAGRMNWNLIGTGTCFSSKYRGIPTRPNSAHWIRSIALSLSTIMSPSPTLQPHRTPSPPSDCPCARLKKAPIQRRTIGSLEVRSARRGGGGPLLPGSSRCQAVRVIASFGGRIISPENDQFHIHSAEGVAAWAFSIFALITGCSRMTLGSANLPMTSSRD